MDKTIPGSSGGKQVLHVKTQNAIFGQGINSPAAKNQTTDISTNSTRKQALGKSKNSQSNPDTKKSQNSVSFSGYNVTQGTKPKSQRNSPVPPGNENLTSSEQSRHSFPLTDSQKIHQKVKNHSSSVSGKIEDHQPCQKTISFSMEFKTNEKEHMVSSTSEDKEVVNANEKKQPVSKKTSIGKKLLNSQRKNDMEVAVKNKNLPMDIQEPKHEESTIETNLSRQVDSSQNNPDNFNDGSQSNTDHFNDGSQINQEHFNDDQFFASAARADGRISGGYFPTDLQNIQKETGQNHKNAKSTEPDSSQSDEHAQTDSNHNAPKTHIINKESTRNGHQNESLQFNGCSDFNQNENVLGMTDVARKHEHSSTSTHSPSVIGITATKESIVDLEVDVIVSSEDSTLSGQGIVANIIDKKGGNLLQTCKECILKMCPQIQAWTFQPTPATGKLKNKHIFHAVVPFYVGHTQKEWQDGFRHLIFEIFRRTDNMGYQSIALPVLGTGKNSAPTDMVIDLLCETLDDFAGKNKSNTFLSSVFIVNPDKKILKNIKKRMESLKNCVSKDIIKGRKETKPPKQSYFLSVSDRQKDNCPICMEEVSRSKLQQLSKCRHVFCRKCIEQCFKMAPSCPVCNTVYGDIIGNQPDGIMVETFHRDVHLPGYDDCGTIMISYSFPDGKQSKNHPKPGFTYKGTRRMAYLPDNDEGQKVHRLLRRAFDQRLVFTIGHSRTTGRDDVVTWNDVHHKTKMDGGPEKFGYPDPEYISRVLAELAAKGVTEN